MQADRPESETPAQRLERMMAQHGDGLLRLCFLMLQDRALAEDAVQETFLKAHRSYDSFRGNSSEYTWLSAIAANHCKSLRRTAWFNKVDLEDAFTSLPSNSKVEDESDDTVYQAVLSLPNRYKDPVILHYYLGLKVKDIALILRLPQSTVSVLLHRARTKLKAALKEWYYEEIL